MIREILKDLKPDQYKEIKLAFDNELPCIILLPGGTFIAVNYSNPNYTVVESKGVWSYGKCS